ncbi:MAG: cytochrome c3 family protein, partial [Thermodesulfobacteriota bacterium]
REDRVCYACHSDSREHTKKSRYAHPKIGVCSNCHAAHGSNNRYFLAKGADTCAAEKCHATQGRFTHPVGEAIIDPRNKSPMDCNSCHNVMGAPEEFNLRANKDLKLCEQCHQL